MTDQYDNDNTNVGANNKDGKVHQKFSIIYVDQMPAETKKGELDKEFGLYVERPFHVISGLKEERYYDSISRSHVIKTPNGRSSQLFYFDVRSKTIRTMENRR
jgi:hypothetical protein